MRKFVGNYAVPKAPLDWEQTKGIAQRICAWGDDHKIQIEIWRDDDLKTYAKVVTVGETVTYCKAAAKEAKAKLREGFGTITLQTEMC